MTYTNFKFETDSDGIALITWDMPGKSMNVFTEEVMNELDSIIDKRERRGGDQGCCLHLRQGFLLRRRGPDHAEKDVPGLSGREGQEPAGRGQAAV